MKGTSNGTTMELWWDKDDPGWCVECSYLTFHEVTSMDTLKLLNMLPLGRFNHEPCDKKFDDHTHAYFRHMCCYENGGYDKSYERFTTNSGLLFSARDDIDEEELHSLYRKLLLVIL